MNKKRKNSAWSTLLPLFYGALVGALVGAVVVVFKLCAKVVIAFSEEMYAAAKEQWWIALLLLAAFAVIAVVSSLIYKKVPNARGGGIPTSIGIVRGLIPFHWVKNLIAVFGLSLSGFFVGVPLGTEGPSVQIGTAIGRGVTRVCARKRPAGDRYLMTGGACAGFTTATGAPVSGIMFALEEAHQRISPMILMVTTVSVVFSKIVSDLLSLLVGVSTALFPAMQPLTLGAKDLWLPALIGLVVGLFSVAFLKYYTLLQKFWSKKLSRIPALGKILIVFALTFAFGMLSYSNISTGHELMIHLFEEGGIWYWLLLCLAVRSTLMILASSSGITGGLFLPLMSLGALVAAVVAALLHAMGLGMEYYSIIMILGITACLAGMMKMPVTAMVFALEALFASSNVLPVILAALISYAITEIFEVHSITDSVLHNRIRDQHGDVKPAVYDGFVTVKAGSFAVGKQIRDILWPNNMFVLSVKRETQSGAVMDEHGEKYLHVGDELHVRYSTYDRAATRAELSAIVGEQQYAEENVEKV
ncbi:MAG: chloride channel protein [Clostridia bacterium]|nr:chloride channel protein [Clostridia bacterium]